MIIIPYESQYRDDMIFMVLQAKDALGLVPHLNPDLLDVDAYYIDSGDYFWLALDEHSRVIGCLGYHPVPGTKEARLHRFYVKADLKHSGIGSAMLHHAEAYLVEHGFTAASVHLGGEAYWESRLFYPKNGYVYTDCAHLRKELVSSN